MKKIILILIVIILILISGIFIFNYTRNLKPQPADTEVEPTGIVVPTEEVREGELDIVNISPKDSATNIGLNTPLEIMFSRDFTMQEIEFFILPNTSHSILVKDSKLEITPSTSWNPGTYYTFSINFVGEPEKVRLYHFTTTGPTQEFLPDTQPENGYEDMLNDQKENDTDNYVANNTPYENSYFSVRSAYESKTPAHFYFTITKRNADQTQVEQAVNVWLQGLDLSEEQIQSLDIRYE